MMIDFESGALLQAYQVFLIKHDGYENLSKGGGEMNTTLKLVVCYNVTYLCIADILSVCIYTAFAKWSDQ